ncbi:MAG: hypothetical protein GY715_03680, partial [Planctomycetes bacterium]|nr:hypothetical protein [Planctomycetota bacterium]
DSLRVSRRSTTAASMGASCAATKGRRGPSPLGSPLPPGRAGASAVTLNYGTFINTVLDFIIVAFAIFMVIKAMNAAKKKEEAKPAAPPKPSNEEVLLGEIRDALKAGR